MAPRKPTWDWKARDCAEFKHFTVAFAVKEYVQNVVGQALKDLKVREWSEWSREDLRELPAKQREQRKQSLIVECPGLLTGPHGAALKRTKAWVPWYILSAKIPQSRLRTMITTTDLRIALVVWRHTTAEIGALSVYNNHLDSRAKFSSFTVDGASTSRHNEWAVGEKGKGFILATQYLFERIEAYILSLKNAGRDLPKEGISFRVGHQIGTLKWKKSRYPDEDDLLQVVLDDLTPLTVEEYMEKQAADARHKNKQSSDEDDDDVDVYGYGASIETPKLRKTAEAALKGVYTRRVTQQLDCKGDHEVFHNRGRCLVSTDEVAITVVGLDGTFQPEYLFSAIYGIIPPPQAWRVPDSQVQFFIAAADQTDHDPEESTKTKFYHRDQYVPYGLHLNRLSVNYHGDLNITSDRVAILRDRKVHAYKLAVSSSADEAFKTMPDLAMELALDILSDEHSEGLAHLVRPRDTQGADAYRTAFETAMRKLHPEIAEDAPIHPTPGSVDEGLFKELDLTPIAVSAKAWEIMEKAGAYVTVEEHARQVLLASPSVPDSKGLQRLRVALSVVAPNVPEDHITVRNYDKSTPNVVWDKDNNLFAFALPPKCEDHPTGPCFCWIGPFLHDAAKDYDGEQLSTRKLFRAYLLCMKGDANMAADGLSEVNDDDDMDIDDFGQDDGGDVNRSPVARKARKNIVNSDSDDDYYGIGYLPDMHRESTAESLSAPSVHSAPKSPVNAVFNPEFGQSPQRVSTPPLQYPPDNARAETVAPVSRAPSAAPLDEVLPAPSSAGMTARKPSPPVLTDTDADAALATLASVVANHKEQKAALADATAMMNSLQLEIDLCKTSRDSLETQVEVLKIDCATHQRRIEELNRTGELKDATIAELQVKVEDLTVQIEESETSLETFLKSRKKPRVN